MQIQAAFNEMAFLLVNFAISSADVPHSAQGVEVWCVNEIDVYGGAKQDIVCGVGRFGLGTLKMRISKSWMARTREIK